MLLYHNNHAHSRLYGFFPLAFSGGWRSSRCTQHASPSLSMERCGPSTLGMIKEMEGPTRRSILVSGTTLSVSCGSYFGGGSAAMRRSCADCDCESPREPPSRTMKGAGRCGRDEPGRPRERDWPRLLVLDGARERRLPLLAERCGRLPLLAERCGERNVAAGMGCGLMGTVGWGGEERPSMRRVTSCGAPSSVAGAAAPLGAGGAAPLGALLDPLATDSDG